MKLLEIIQPPSQSDQLLTDRQQIASWLDQNKVVNYNITGEGVVNVDGNVYIHARELTAIPVQFGEIRGDFACSFNRLTSLRGSPRIVHGEFICTNNNLSSLDGCPSVAHDLRFGHNPIQSFSGMHKRIKQAKAIWCDDHVTHILGVMLIPHMESFYVGDTSKISHIINKHLRGDRDMLACQAELIDAGFSAQAKL